MGLTGWSALSSRRSRNETSAFIIALIGVHPVKNPVFMLFFPSKEETNA
jgi:hypothetical protein